MHTTFAQILLIPSFEWINPPVKVTTGSIFVKIYMQEFHMKSFCTFLTLLFVLGSVSLWAAPKSRQVERYLGNFRYENDEPRGIVKFVFQNAILKREGNGKRTYKQLLFGQPYYSDEDNAGRLLAIQIVNRGQTITVRPEAPDNGADVAEEKPEPAPRTRSRKNDDVAQASSQDPMRSRNNAPRTYRNMSIPDSLDIANSIDEARDQVGGWKETMWQNAKPVWSFIMWIFNSLIVLLICFGGLCRYVAKTAAAESLMNIYGRVIVGRWIISAHQNAAAMLLFITWIVAIIMLVDVFMWLVYLELPIWLLLVIWFPILWASEKLTNWVVPNVRILGK